MTPAERVARLIEGHALIEADAEELIAALLARTPPHTRFTVDAKARTPAAAIAQLDRLTHPASRHLLFVAADGWVGWVTNRRDGSDVADELDAARRTGVCARALRVVDQPSRVWRRAKLREVLGYEARILAINATDPASAGSIACLHDGGRWTFERTGPIAHDLPCAPRARRVRDRFTSDHLRQAREALGAPIVDVATVLAARRCWLLHEQRPAEWSRRIEDGACSWEQRDDPAWAYFRRGLGFVAHLPSHAASMIADLERAVRIDPGYAERAAPHLAAARRALDQG